MKFTFLLLIVLASFSSFAEGNRIKRGADISISAYEPKCGCFEITITKEPAVGPNYATPESLAHAVKFVGGAEAIKAKKTELVGKVFPRIENDLKLISDEQIEKLGL